MLNASTNRMTAELARQARLAGDIASAQRQISTGKRIEAASDDPDASARIARIARTQADQTTWTDNVAFASTLAAQADQTIGSLSDTVVQARELLIAGSTGTATPADRATIASRLRSLAGQVAELSATRSPTDEPLFASGSPLAIRVSNGQLLTPVGKASDVFESGGALISNHLIDAAVALETNDRTAINISLSALSDSVDRVTEAWSAQGNQAATLASLAERHAVSAADLAVARSSLEDADVTQAVATLNAKTLTLEAAQAAFARLNRRTLFDLLG